MKPEDKEKTQTELAQKFVEATDTVKATAEEIKGRMEKGEKLSSDAKEAADEALTKFNELSLQVKDIEQKASRRGSDGESVQKSLGERFAESGEFKAFAENPRGQKHAKISLKAENITSATTATAGAAGALIQPTRVSGIIAPPNQRLTMRDLIMSGTTDSNSIEYMRETGFTNAATAQAKEGDKKAQSDIKFAEVVAGVKTLAHYVKVSRQVLDDAAQLRSHIDGRLLYGLKLVEDRQILNGDGTAGNLLGIIPQATAFADPTAMASYTLIDQLRLAQLQAVLAEYPASGQVLHPIDWAKIELTKDNEGRYIIGQPQGSIAKTLWGIPVVDTPAMASGKFLVGAFDLGAQIFDRMQAMIELGFENDDFTRNMLTILCEERLALAVYRPEAFIYGTLAAK